MARWIVDRTTGQLVPAEEYYAGKAKARLHVISDTMDPVRSMADGKTYDSKSRYRAEVRARGFIEVGNEWTGNKRPEMPSVASDLARHFE